MKAPTETESMREPCSGGCVCIRTPEKLVLAPRLYKIAHSDLINETRAVFRREPCFEVRYVFVSNAG